MNLPVWRAEQIGEQALRFAVEHADVIKWADQCALNAVCNGRAKICSPRWNAGQWVYSGTTAEQLGVEPHELEQAKVDPVIAHYSGSDKPWYGATTHPFAHEYYQYLKRTPYFGARHLVRRLASKGRQMLGKVSFR
jgi:lipopolysaccharide biosynthesis glycosyltransferase